MTHKKLITGSVLLLGVGVVVVAGITLYPSLRERYWIWKLDNGKDGQERLEAAEKLGDIGSTLAVPRLITEIETSLEDVGGFWFTDMLTSRLRLFNVRGQQLTHGRNRGMSMPLICLDSISKIAQRRPAVTVRLESYLASEDEITRAVAASVLFDGTDKAKQYVSTDRILFGNLIMDSETGPSLPRVPCRV